MKELGSGMGNEWVAKFRGQSTCQELPKLIEPSKFERWERCRESSMGLESRRQTVLGAWTSFVLQVYKLVMWLYFIPGSEKRLSSSVTPSINRVESRRQPLLKNKKEEKEISCHMKLVRNLERSDLCSVTLSLHFQAVLNILSFFRRAVLNYVFPRS